MNKINIKHMYDKESLFKDFGTRIQKERIEKGYSINDIVAQLKISTYFVKSIEDGEIKDMPHWIYTKGFIRSYALLLGIKENEIQTFFRKIDSPVVAAEETVEKRRWGKHLYVYGIIISLVIIGSCFFCFDGFGVAKFIGSQQWISFERFIIKNTGLEKSLNIKEKDSYKNTDVGYNSSQQKEHFLNSNNASIDQNKPPIVVEQTLVEELPVSDSTKLEDTKKVSSKTSKPESDEVHKKENEKQVSTVSDSTKLEDTKKVSSKTSKPESDEVHKKENEKQVSTVSDSTKLEDTKKVSSKTSKPESDEVHKKENEKQVSTVSGSTELEDTKKVSSKTSKYEDESKYTQKNNSNPKNIVILKGVEECWVHATIDTKETKQIYVQQGQSFSFFFSESLVLKLGNAGGVEIKYNGEKIQPVGQSGQVKIIEFPST